MRYFFTYDTISENTEVSRRTGIATSTISGWRKKKINPQADKLVDICKSIDMSPVDLFCDEEGEHEQEAKANAAQGILCITSI